MTESFVHHPRYAVSARTGLTAATALSFPAAAVRGPAMLVPVDVQALVVAPGSAVEHADVRSRVFDRSAPMTARPEPFTPNLPDRSPGVHLHWALPDGLTQGRTAGPDRAPRWRALPDRWVVLRLLPTASTRERRRPVEGWVIEAERRRVTPLDSWRPGPPQAGDPAPATPLLDPADLTVMTAGDPTWTATYDDVENRFALRDGWDTLAAPPTGPVAYVVAGWYSRPELDPLAGLGTGTGFAERIAELGWSVDDTRLTELQRAAEAESAQLHAVGLDATTAGAPAGTLRNRLAGRSSAAPRPWWPQRTVFHGVIYGVRLDKPPPDQRPAAAAVRVGLGPSAEQATAALLAAGLGDPGLETLQATFGHGLTDTLGRPDGTAAVEAELHSAGFDSSPGGDRTERVLTGDPFAAVRPPSPTPATDRLRAADGPTRLTFLRGGSRVADLHTLRHTPERLATPEPRTVTEVTAPAPRWFTPRDPALVLRGLRRTLRHGYDGRFEPGETLAARLTGDTVSKLLGFIDGRELLDREVGNAEVPSEAQALLVEAAVEDPFQDFSQILERYAGRFAIPYTQLLALLRAESRVFRWWLASTGGAIDFLALSQKDGVGAAPLGITIWQQAWVPLHLEWELELALDPATGWPLGELDRVPPPGAGFTPGTGRILRGRTLLTSASARALADGIRGFLATEDQLDLGDAGRVPQDVERRLQGLADDAGRADLLTATLGGMRDALLGYRTDLATGGAERVPSELPVPIRAGFGRVRRLRVVDAFGRTLDLIASAAPAPALARNLVPATAQPAGTAVLAPRLTRPARMMLRLVDHRDDGVEVAVDQAPAPGAAVSTPVAGWLLPDHADGALEVFDAAGEPLGQLAHDPLTGAVVWEGPPGDRAPLGSSAGEGLAGPDRRHLLGLAAGLLASDTAERRTGQARSDTPLEALLRVVGATAATVGLGGQGGTEHVAQLLGRPIAVVRAVLRLEIEAEPPWPGLSPAAQADRDAAFDALLARRFPVRLGALTRLDDGLLGWYADDDYGRLIPVHESVAALAPADGRHRGDYGDPRDGAGTDADPIDSGYLAGDATLWLRPGRTVRLTLLQDPAAKVHVTSGLVPRKAIGLLRDWTEGPLGRLAPSFRIGPVLVDPGSVRMPPAAALGARQQWSRRDGPLSWKDDAVTAATQQALLPETAAVAEEGYLRAAAAGEGGQP